MKQSFFNLILLLAFFTTSSMAADTEIKSIPLPTLDEKVLPILPQTAVVGSWTKMPGSNVKVIAGGGHKLMMINNRNDLFEWNYDNGNWMATARKATDVAIDHNNTIWTIEPDGNVYAFYPGTGEKDKIGNDGNAKAIGAGGTKTMKVNKDNSLYEFNYRTKKWMATGRKAIDVAVDNEETIWTIKPDFSIHRFYPKTGVYNQRAGFARRIGAGVKGLVATPGNDGTIFIIKNRGANVNLGYKAKDVGVDYNGHIWIASTDGSVYRYN